MNVLLTSVGRRSYLVEYFKQALKGKGKVIGANMYADVSGMYAADEAITVPPANSPEYIPSVLDICRRHDIKLLCSLHDLDVYILSRHREVFENEGVMTTLPSAEWGRICLDKYECMQTLEKAGISVPRTSLHLEEIIAELNSGVLDYPVVVKARIGFGSLGLKWCSTERELRDAYSSARMQILDSDINNYISTSQDELVLIQPAIQGREICIGILNDLNGKYHAHFSCEVHEMRAGESDSATSLGSALFDNIARRFGNLSGHKGIWGVDCLDDDGIMRVIDVNPRFTGDYPFHHLAGANVPAVLLAWLSGAPVDDRWLTAKVGVRGYKKLVPTVAC